MTLFVDTSVWSLVFRRDAESAAPEVRALRHALEGAETIVTTGLVLQELLQGSPGRGPAKTSSIASRPCHHSLRNDRITVTPQNCEIAVVAPVCRLAQLTRCSRSYASGTN